MGRQARDLTAYIVYLDFLLTVVGAFAIYSTNFIAYNESSPVFGTVYGVVIALRGLLPLFLHDERLFRLLPLVHLPFLFLVVTLSLALNDVDIYLAGISISALLGIYTGSYVYSLEVSWSKRLSDPSRFFSLVSGSEALAFFIAPLLTYITPDRTAFLLVLAVLVALGLTFLLYFARNVPEVKPKFFSGDFTLLKSSYPLLVLASLNWCLQYLWMGTAFELGVRQGIPGSLVSLAVEAETALYMAIQFAVSRRGLGKLVNLRAVALILTAYASVVTAFTSLLFVRAGFLTFLSLLLAIAVVSSPLEPLINALASRERAQEVSILVVSFDFLGGGLGYVLSSLLLRA